MLIVQWLTSIEKKHINITSLFLFILQVLIITLDQEATDEGSDDSGSMPDNLFLNYLSRIHREEDFHFVLRGVTRYSNFNVK